MPVDMISEEELRLALKPYRVAPEEFEAAVRERVEQNTGDEYDPLDALPPWLRSAASLLPFEVLTAGKLTGTAIKSTLFGYVAFPAISLFVLLGSTILGVANIRRIQSQSSSEAMDQQTLADTTRQWWHDHRWGALLLFAATLALSWFGATWLMFLGYIVSALILVYILKSFAGLGIGNRLVVGSSCTTGLILLGQVAGFAGIGDGDLHVLDQAMLAPLFLAGATGVNLAAHWGSRKRVLFAKTGRFAILTVVMAAWFMKPIFWPATPARINAYVASFDRAEFSSASWREWEIVASWAVQSNPAPDFSRPRRLLAETIADQQDPTLPEILHSALKVGLVRSDQVSQLKDYESRLRALLEAPATGPISPSWDDWVIRAAVLRNDLTPEQRDYLEKRLHATLRWSLSRDTPRSLNEPLRATQLLAVIGRPVDPRQYRTDIHALLKRTHSTTGGGFQRSGGFKAIDLERIRVGNIDSTSDAVELMETYGIPKDLDMNWVRSSLRPSIFLEAQKWTAAATLDRVDHLPGITRPSWFDMIYYERSFLAAVILIGLSIYATAISPYPGTGLSSATE